MEDTYSITHIFVRPIEERGWVKLTYLVERGGKYYLGEKGKKELKTDGIEKLIRENVLIKLENPVTVKKDKTIWLTPENEVYSSSKLNPLGKNQDKTFLCKI